MISSNQALQLITQNCLKINKSQRLPLAKSLGFVLAESIYADRDLPSADKSAMDGIAVSFKAYKNGQRKFKVLGVQKAVDKQAVLRNFTACFRIMTGAIIPKGADLVIPVEYCTLSNDGFVTVNALDDFKLGQFIRLKGSDAKKGDLLLASGVIINPVVMGLLASVGKTQVKVSRVIKVAIIATGDELVDIKVKPKAHQTRLSNSVALAGLFQQMRFVQVACFHLKDNPLLMKAQLTKLLKAFDCVVLSGGVSKGDFDYVPEVLTNLGVKNIFHQVLQKPGKPLWFGKAHNGTIVFGLPGNPVSTIVCAYRYVVKALYLLAGANNEISKTISIVDPIKQSFAGTQFLPFNNQVICINNSGDFIGLAKSNGFIQYDSGESNDQCPYFSWRF